MMTNSERAMRLGCYAGTVAATLGDSSYARQLLDRDMRTITEEEYQQFASAMQARLLEAGIIGPDEDPFEDLMRKIKEGSCLTKSGS